ncbi:MAG TPA: histidinol dehydrogenase [Pyrinomonadaceae bacterium]
MIPIIHSAEVTPFLFRLARRSVVRDSELLQMVSSIIEDVRSRDDDALIDYTKKFDGVELTNADLHVSEETLRHSASKVDENFLIPLRRAIKNVRTFHEQQVEKSWEFSPAPGVRLGQRITPLERVGLYVPGGTAAYPSSIVMNVVPAQVAQVERIIIATPPRTLAENPAIAATLLELNVTEVYRVGGAQAMAALAFGTETIPRVDKIVGPGNKYVAAAKKLLFGIVGIDAIAGPSEIVIIADETARADFLAVDLLAQAEHGEDASAILFTTSELLAVRVAAEVQRQAESLPRRDIVASSLKNYGAIIVLETLEAICAVVNNAIAPEHLEIVTADDGAIARTIRNAGAIFFGTYTPEAVGDYLAGPNHVLPTSGTARFTSALGVYDFLKRTSTLQYSASAFDDVADSISVLAESEGLAAHARSAAIRKKR